MQKRIYYFPLIVVAMASALFACNMAGTTTVPQNTPDTSGNSVVQTMAAELTPVNKPQVTLKPAIDNVLTSPIPISSNPPHGEFLEPTATIKPRPCNQASFVENVSIPDGTVIMINKAFTKTWRLKNTGSCTWTSAYQLVFVSGDQMSGPRAQPLTSSTVYPGDTVDVTVTLVVPASEGTYRGYWKIREPVGLKFGVSTGAFWVEITAKNSAAPPVEPSVETKMPDLLVSEFTIFPVTPIKGQPAHVRLRVYNQGNQPASQFTVLWYGLSTFANPSCSWDVLDVIPPNGGRILDCDFVFQRSYPINKTSLVIVDSANQVIESDEGNNQGIISPFGVVTH